MKGSRKLFTAAVLPVVATAFLVAFAYGPGSAAAQTPSAADLARRPSAAAHARAVAAARAPSGGPIDPSPIPTGWTCAGNCGTDGADGVITLSPTANTAYEWVSTSGGTPGVGALPTGSLGSETNGSTLSTPVFAATAGSPLAFYFNYVTSDGSGFADYAWAELFNSSNAPVALLFTARTVPSGSIVPGSGMPSPLATLTPPSVPIIGGGPAWAPLGGDSGQCFSSGCGYTGWVKSTYTIPAAGNYYLKVGVVNWSDQAFDTGLAVDGVSINGVTIPTGIGTTPVPPAFVLALFGLAALGLFVALSRRHIRA